MVAPLALGTILEAYSAAIITTAALRDGAIRVLRQQSGYPSSNQGSANGCALPWEKSFPALGGGRGEGPDRPFCFGHF